MESEFRGALVEWLRADPALAARVNRIEEEGPVASSPPSMAIVASASSDWSSKTSRGREIRVAIELTSRDDAGHETAETIAATESRIATLPPVQHGFRVVVTQFLRSRAERRKRETRAVLLEYRFRILETPVGVS